jgi:hypothetical protein
VRPEAVRALAAVDKLEAVLIPMAKALEVTGLPPAHLAHLHTEGLAGVCQTVLTFCDKVRWAAAVTDDDAEPCPAAEVTEAQVAEFDRGVAEVAEVAEQLVVDLRTMVAAGGAL